jgi:serine protease Do
MTVSQTPQALTADISAVVARLREITVEVRSTGPARGAGVIWHASGLVVTSAHVLARAQRARADTGVVMPDRRALTAAPVGWDEHLDLALLRIEASGLRAATLGDANRLRAGELVLAVGHPFGLPGAVVTGVVHAAPVRQRRDRYGWIQADLRLAPGNSGGPMADASGRVIGVSTMIASGLALAVPSHVVQAFVMRSIGP